MRHAPRLSLEDYSNDCATNASTRCLTELITIHINISLCTADMMAIVSLLLALFYFISIGNRLFVVRIFGTISYLNATNI
jgi:hypothetical protein